jgi:hypothetical protein
MDIISGCWMTHPSTMLKFNLLPWGIDSNLVQAGWSRDRNPPREGFSATFQTSPGAHPASYTTATGSLTLGQSGQGVASTTDPCLVPSLRKEYSYTSIPPLCLCSLLWDEFTFGYLLPWGAEGGKKADILKLPTNMGTVFNQQHDMW